MLRTSVWLALVVVVMAMTSACGPTQRCSPLNCTGCCDTSGMCRSGSESSACGRSGNTCTACSAGASCSFGTCGAGGSSAGAAGGGTGAGGGAGASGGTAGGSSGNTVTDWASWCRLSQAAFVGFSLKCGEYTAQGAMEIQQLSTQYCLTHPPPGLADGRASLDVATAQACVELFNGGSCAVGVPSGCLGLLRGLVPANGSCFATDECTASSWCDSSTTCPGRCVPRVAVGLRVTGDAECVTNAYPVNGVCTAHVASGQSCAPIAGTASPQPCLNGICVNNVCGPGTPDLPAGAACTINTNPECSRGLWCIGGTCRPLGDVNGACDSARPCKFDLICGPANICVRRGGVGAACESGVPCASDLSCTATRTTPTGVCRLKQAAAGACTFDNGFEACREGLYCTATMTTPTGVCANLKGGAATCRDSGECESRNCSQGRCTAPPCRDPTP